MKRRTKKIKNKSCLAATIFILTSNVPVFAATDPSGELAEIVVTAEKRNSTVQDTPISMTALSGAQLESRGYLTLEDLVGNVPGLSIRSAGPGQTEYEMRGMGASGGSTATVGFYLDDTPLSPSAISANGRTVIDPDLFDTNHVELLRGPQGTLYGAGSMGGTIRMVTNPPQLRTFDNAASIDASRTQGGSTNGGGSLMLNLPIADSAAVRWVTTDKYISGWIDRKVVASPTTGAFPFPSGLDAPGCGSTVYFCTRGDVANATVLKDIKGSNLERFLSTRASLLLEPSDVLSIKGTVMYQRIDAEGYNAYQDPPGLSSLSLYQPSDIKSPYDDEFKLGSLSITYTTPGAVVTSATSYWKRVAKQHQDSTEALQDIFNLTQFLPITFEEDDTSSQLSEELRVTSNSPGPFQWVSGIFFENLHSLYDDTNQNAAYATATACPLPYSGGNCPAGLAYNPNNGGAAANPTGIVYDAINPNTTKQEAVFGELSYKITPDLKLTTGVRLYKFGVTNSTTYRGLGSSTGNATPYSVGGSSSGSGVLPKLNLSYEPTGDLTLYGTAAKGQRPGGFGIAIPLSLCGPGTGPIFTTSTLDIFGPDSVWSYELGEKARFADRRFTVNSDIYYVKWTNIQQNQNLSCGFGLQANVGEAKTYGPELEVSAKIIEGLTADLSSAYTQAFINAPTASSGIAPGTRILNIPRYTGSLAFTYEMSIGSDMHGTIRLASSLVGPSRDIAFLTETLPTYTLLDGRAGFGKGDWMAFLFATNITNKRAELSTNNSIFGWQGPTFMQVTTNQPRTVGLELQTKF